MGTVYDGYMAAKRVIRAHPDWTDAQVAEAAGIHPLMVAETVAPARRDVAVVDGAEAGK